MATGNNRTDLLAIEDRDCPFQVFLFPLPRLQDWQEASQQADYSLAPKIHTWCSFTGVEKDYFQCLITSMWLEPDQSKLSSLAHFFLVVFPILILGMPQ